MATIYEGTISLNVPSFPKEVPASENLIVIGVDDYREKTIRMGDAWMNVFSDTEAISIIPVGDRYFKDEIVDTLIVESLQVSMTVVAVIARLLVESNDGLKLDVEDAFKVEPKGSFFWG